jgi:TonB-dependent receptor
LVQNTGSTSFLGFDKSRQWSSSFPQDLKSPDIIYNAQAQEDAAKSLTNDWELNNKNILPDGRFGFTTGNFFHIGKVKVSNISAINYSKTTTFYEATRTRNLYVTSSDFNPLFDYKDRVTTQNSRIGLISNFNFHLNERHTISFKNLYNQSGIAETNYREGLNKKGGSSPNAWLEVKDRSLYYQERGILTSQVEGDHQLENNKTALNWALGYSYVFRNEPDWKRAGYQRTNLSNDTFRVVIPPQATDNDAARFSSELKENVIAASGNLEHQLTGTKDSLKLTGILLKTGVYFERRTRTFSSRWMSYVRGNSANFNYDLEKQPLETIFDSQNINQQTGFILNEGTDGSNKYDASNQLIAGYAGLAIPLFEKMIVNAGARVEHNRQKLNTKNSGNQVVKVDNPITNFLPSVNVNYNVTDKNIVRASYAKTINRPDFRELAPFGFYDFNNNWKINGNPNLKNAESNNLDLRLERYPSEQEMISLGVFYKNIINPIEFYIQPIGGQDQNYEYRNAPKATVYGLEFEFKKSLAFISQRVFKHVSFMTNASIIQSEVKLGNSQGGQADKRALVGQSPYIINAGLYYDYKDLGWNVGLNYNMFGNRILSIGDQNFATLYELTRHVVDLTVTKTVKQKLDIKFGISDLLNAPVRYAEDGDRNFKITSNDQVVTKYRRGSYFTLGATYKF